MGNSDLDFSQEVLKRAFGFCQTALQHAYCPYSHFPVASVVKVAGRDRFFPGCNVENASYGATLCAERVALTSLIAAMGKQPLDFLMLMTQKGDEKHIPCGNCLQVLQEFCEPSMPIYIASPGEILHQFKMKELLPKGFVVSGS